MDNQETVEQTNEQATQTDHDKVVNSPAFQAGLKKAMAQDNETDKSDSVESVETLESLEYDRNANSKMPLTIPRGANIFHTQIEFAPVSDDEFLALMEATKQTGERLKKLTIDFYDPLVALGKQKAVNAFGYAEKQGGWRAAVSDADYSQGIIKALDCTARHELEETTELLDYDTPVKMAVFFFDNQGYEAKKYIYYKQAAKAHLDEYLAAKSGEPQRNVLASSVKKTFNQRMLELARQLLDGSDYKTDIPCWHLLFSVVTYLDAEISRLGKF